MGEPGQTGGLVPHGSLRPSLLEALMLRTLFVCAYAYVVACASVHPHYMASYNVTSDFKTSNARGSPSSPQMLPPALLQTIKVSRIGLSRRCGGDLSTKRPTRTAEHGRKTRNAPTVRRPGDPLVPQSVPSAPLGSPKRTKNPQIDVQS